MPKSWRDPSSGCTRHQLMFVEGVGRNLPYHEAYALAYTTRNLRFDEVKRRAQELARVPEVAAELARIRERARDRCAYGVADAVHEAELARQLAMEEKQAAAATGAVTLKAKLLGLMTDKVEQTVKQAPPSLPELEQQLRQIMSQLGITPPADLGEIARDNIVPFDKRA